jgi:hypothetical protein
VPRDPRLRQGQRAIARALALEPHAAHAHAVAACLAAHLADAATTRTHADQAEAALASEDRASRMYDITRNLLNDARRRIAAQSAS